MTEYPNQVRIDGTSSNRATIAERQGSISEAADNCFDNPTSAIRASQNYTRNFSYYVYDFNVHPVACEVPTGNLSDGGTNNYYIQGADDQRSCGSQPNIQEFSDSDLTAARVNTASKKATYTSTPTTQNLNSYLDAAAHQDSVLRYLVMKAFDEEDFDMADSLMFSERTKSYRRGVVGLRTQRGDISGAQNALDSIPQETQDDEWFEDIMLINFKVAQSDTLYQLTSTEEALLNVISGVDTSLMTGYACALLSLCAGYSCQFELEDPESFQSPGIVPGPIASQANTQVSVYPNPTEGILEIRLNLSNEDPVVIEVQDLSGRTIMSHKVLARGVRKEKIQIEEAGFYLVSIKQFGKNIYVEKIVVVQ